jgi:hypothetical protein
MTRRSLISSAFRLSPIHSTFYCGTGHIACLRRARRSEVCRKEQSPRQLFSTPQDVYFMQVRTPIIHSNAEHWNERLLLQGLTRSRLFFTRANTYPVTRTILPMFFFPNWCCVLERINCITTSFKRLGTMRTTDCN